VKKIAIFVEGQTELIFVTKILEEICGQHAAAFTLQSQQSGRIVVIRADDVNDQSVSFLNL
jgi:hypothetical protein